MAAGPVAVCQNLLLEIAQLLPWFQAKFLREDAAGSLIGVQCLGAVSAPLQRRHQQRPAPFPQRVLARQVA
jgi:hypothetical protein